MSLLCPKTPRVKDGPKDGDLRVWWMPQVPGEPFVVDVNTSEQGEWLLEVLADYDLFQLEHKIKPDFCNVGGVLIFEDGEWVDWGEE